MFASIIKSFRPGTSERIITDSAEAMREFDRLREEDLGDNWEWRNGFVNEVFNLFYPAAFAPERLMRPDTIVKRKFTCKQGEARHLVLKPEGFNFEVKISKRATIVKKNYNHKLMSGGCIADYQTVNIHIKLDGVRCFSGELQIYLKPEDYDRLDTRDIERTQIVRISYLRTPLNWEYVLKNIPLASTRRYRILKDPREYKVP